MIVARERRVRNKKEKKRKEKKRKEKKRKEKKRKKKKKKGKSNNFENKQGHQSKNQPFHKVLPSQGCLLFKIVSILDKEKLTIKKTYQNQRKRYVNQCKVVHLDSLPEQTMFCERKTILMIDNLIN